MPDTATQAVITKIYITSNTGTTALTKAYTLNPVTISPGKTATIVIPTVACTSANLKYSLSAKLQYSYSTPAGNVIGYENALEEVKKITNSHMADVVIESIGEKFWDLSYSLLSKNGLKPMLVVVMLELGLKIPMLYNITATMTMIKMAQP